MGLVFIKIMSALCAVEQPRAWTISARFTPGTSDQSLQSVPPQKARSTMCHLTGSTQNLSFRRSFSSRPQPTERKSEPAQSGTNSVRAANKYLEVSRTDPVSKRQQQ